MNSWFSSPPPPRSPREIVEGDAVEAFYANGNPLNPTFDSGLTLQAATAVPEPASLALWTLAALACAASGYRRRRTSA